MAAFLAIPALSACNPNALTEEEKEIVGSLSLASLPALPADPSNRVADDPLAAALGASLFFDTGLSGDGLVSCATCHMIEKQFQDSKPRAVGVSETNRRTMPLAGVGWSPWMFWDGRRDSLWAQALVPMEDAREHGGNRTGYAHFIAEHYRSRYERIFGPLPSLAHLPRNAGPLGTVEERATWSAMRSADRTAIDRVFANIGKAIAAFERSIVPPETRFDRFAAAVASGSEPQGDAVFSDLEMEGLKLFIGKANCINCHNGPRFTDDHFHNTGVSAVPGLPEDLGRAAAVRQALDDPFNCLGPYSDAEPKQCAELRFAVREGEELLRAYKTPSLRGAASRAPYMHAGQFATLEEVIDHYSNAPDAPAGISEIEGVIFTERGRKALIAFLKTLDVPESTTDP
ncbi:cytochrome c peroxidase [Mesorhizobium sp. J18]|uniref:cytochrome-c peroxidase n=1 Tax=Mesorhizobium sp. J18 TaxID=935263 RepID=UPI0011A97D73|nr:cytochrome c peroxidase [Mesorhizobium sp. J18]